MCFLLKTFQKLKMINDFIELLKSKLHIFLGLLWGLAISVYLLKFIIPEWDRFTRFGKLESKNSWTFFPSIPNKIGWIIFYSFSCIMFFCTFLIKFPPMFQNYLLFIHSSRRFVECFVITKFSKRKMHLVNLLAGLCFYFITPITLAYCVPQTKFIFVFITIAIILNILQSYVHYTISSLEKYSIPYGFLFNRITSPHYLLEILLYFVYFLSCPHILTFLMLFFVCLNLSHQAKMTYDWYCNKFGIEFLMLKRYVLIPYIF